MPKNLRDFVIEVGLLSDDADKKLASLEKRIMKLSSASAKMDSKSVKSKKDEVQLSTSQSRYEQQLNRTAIERSKLRAAETRELDAQLRLQRKIVKQNKAASRGGVSAALRSKATTQSERVGSRTFTLSQMQQTEGFGRTKEGQMALRLQKRFKDFESKFDAAKSEQEIASLRRQYARYNKVFKQTIINHRRYRSELKKTRFAQNSLKDSTRNLARRYVSVFALIGGLQFIRRSVSDIENVQSALLAASGSAEQAGKDFEFVKQKSLEMGLPLTSMARDYSRIAAASNSAGLSVDETKSIFLGAAEASVAFGLSVDDTKGVMRAFTQMLSKQQVMAEELRNQLGERMPTAIADMSKALGVTTKELSKMMENGELGVEHISKMAEVMRRTARESGAYAQAIGNVSRKEQRFMTTLELAASKIGGGNLKGAYTETLDLLSDVVIALTPAFKVLGDSIGVLFNFIIISIRPVIEFFSELGEVIGDIFGYAFGDSELVKELRAASEEANVLNGLFNEVLNTMDLGILTIKRFGLALGQFFGNSAGWLADLFNIGQMGDVNDALKRAREAAQRQSSPEFVAGLRNRSRTSSTSNRSFVDQRNFTFEVNATGNPQEVASMVDQSIQRAFNMEFSTALPLQDQ